MKDKEYMTSSTGTESLLSQLANNLQSAIVIADESRKIILVNTHYCEMFGLVYTSDVLVGTYYTVAAEQTKALFEKPKEYIERINEILHKGEKILNEELILKDGRIILRSYIPVSIDDSQRGHLWKYMDVTEQRNAAEELNKQKKFYEGILNKLPADIAVFNTKHEYLFVNPIAIKDKELRKWIIGKTDFDYCIYKNKPISIAEDRKKAFDRVLTEKIQIEREEQITRPDGKIEYHLRKLYPVLDENGEVDIIIGYGIEITEQKKAEQNIRISEARYRDIFDYSMAMICTHDLNGKILSANPSATKILGYTPDEMVGNPLDMIIPEDHKKDFWEQYLIEIMKKGESKGVMKICTKEGTTKYLLYENYLVPNENGAPYIVGSAQDITERISAQRDLKRSEEKYRSIIDNMNMGLIELDANRQIVYCNERFLQMSGYQPEELINHRLPASLFFPNDDKIKEKIDLRKKGVSDAYEIEARDKKGNVKWWLVSGAPLFSTNGIFSGTIGIFLDITQQKTQEEELRKARKKAEDSSQAKEIFLANMSHEIRTPMNAIMGISKLMQKTVLGEQQKFYLNAIQTASDNLLIVINDILDFTKIEAGKIALENIGFELTALIKHTIYILKPKAEEKNIQLNMYVDSKIQPVLIGDPYRLNQVIMNILTNAIKFTEKGSVDINCSLAAETNNKQEIKIQIKDTGIGMSETFLKQLFEKFTQEDETITRRFGGTGLGMSISKQLVELMNGTIFVTSQKDEGTTFNIKLEFSIGNQKDLPKKKERKVKAPELKEKKILVADDNKLNRIVATTIIKQYSGIPDEADNGTAAIEKILQNKYDLILMDVQMPGKDGIEATKEIREHIDKEIPIIALTASATSGEREKCIDAGMNDFISKPFDEGSFIQTIAQWIKSGSQEIATIPTADKLYDLQKIKMLSGETDDFLKKYLQLFVNEISPLVDEVKTALINKDYKLIAALIHHMKPSLADMGVKSLDDEIINIEKAAVTNDADQTLKPLLEKLSQTINVIISDIDTKFGIKSTV